MEKSELVKTLKEMLAECEENQRKMVLAFISFLDQYPGAGRTSGTSARIVARGLRLSRVFPCELIS